LICNQTKQAQYPGLTPIFLVACPYGRGFCLFFWALACGPKRLIDLFDSLGFAAGAKAFNGDLAGVVAHGLMVIRVS
jgi:hypothetical protein